MADMTAITAALAATAYDRQPLLAAAQAFGRPPTGLGAVLAERRVP